MNLLEISFTILVFCSIVQFLYLFFFTSKISFHKEKKTSNSVGISVIIAARNEFKNLKNNLTKVLDQDYESFEVIVVNDRSWDNSIKFLKEMKKKYLNLKIVNIPDNKTDHFGKKLAITLGIKAAKFNNFLFTDADCYPCTNLWISEMSKGFNNGKKIVLGAGIYKKENGFLNKLIRFDSTQIAINYLSYAKSNLAYMGVGRNMGYTKEIYNLNNGFKSHYYLASGDDDLFVNQSSTKKNTEIVFNESSITISNSKKKLKSWIIQKQRHHTTNYKYKTKYKILLGLQYFSALFFYSSIIFLLLNNQLNLSILFIFIVRYLLIIVFVYKPFKILMCKDLLWKFPFYEIILLICIPIFQFNKEKNIK